MDVIVLGPAGCGKSTLTGEFGRYLKREGYSVRFLNLDPGCLAAPYQCDFDIRERFTVEQIMRSERLGPGGAMVRAMEKLSETEIPKYSADFTLIDTPGQLEVFAFQAAGPKIVRQYRDPVGIFILDACIGIQDLPAIYLYSLATGHRLGIETIRIVNKVDMLRESELEAMREYLGNPVILKKRIHTRGTLSDIYVPLSELLQRVLLAQRNPFVSARTGRGFGELLDLLHEVRCACGDTT
ncbi:ATP/GTP-binding protein [Candidatus Bathyarchaeota archaeon]|nr:ATP/GTP-binding protein [Candidatus Bathyarchaeota archaeon]